jgi:hypothetical protein
MASWLQVLRRGRHFFWVAVPRRFINAFISIIFMFYS